MPKFLIISVKPEYAVKIVNHQKTIELRKNVPNVSNGDYVIIYATMPVKTVVGFAKVKRIIKTTPNQMWGENEARLGISKKAFEEYYANSDVSVGIEFNSITKLNVGFSLQEIKKFIPKFTPPQTYKYLSNLQALRLYKSTL
jgi:predicted transcriptional regulator